MLFALKSLKHHEDLNLRNQSMIRLPQRRTALFLAAVLVAAGWSGPVCAGEERAPNSGADAARLADEVLSRAGGDDLGDWTRSIMERALERAGETARWSVPGRSGQTTPLPAERLAGDLSGPRSDAADILIFTSLSVPAASWRQWARDAAASGAPLVLRGVGEGPGSGPGAGGLMETAKRIGARLGGAQAGVAIDPRLFRLFGVTRVPTVVVVPGGVPPCANRGCAGDAAPPHDLVAGNIGLAAALEAIAAEGTVGRDVARRHLERLRGE